MALREILIFAAGLVLLRLLLGIPFLHLSSSFKDWLLLGASVLALFWLQPLSAIHYLDFWLPLFTLSLVTLSWVLTTPLEQRAGRQNWISAGVLLGLISLVALTRYLNPTMGIITRTRPPAFGQVLLVLALVSAGLLALAKYAPPRSVLLWGGIVILIVLLVIIKLPPLMLAASLGLRMLTDQSTTPASALDLRWLGYSYVAFRLIHTLRDRQSGRLPLVNLREYLTYVIFFPAFTAGPIDRVERFTKDGRKPLEPFAPDLLEAGKRLALGLFKKFVIADSLAAFALNATNATQIQSTGWTWVLLLAYSLQIYFDFSGYTDLALGLARLVGIRLPENFNAPYLKPNLAKFWANWHMSLTQWFRAYFFNPLARSLRSGKRPLSPVAVIFITQVSTMLLIGLWHGITLNFVIWGLWHGVGQFGQNRYSEWVKPHLTGLEDHPRWKGGLAAAGTVLTFIFVSLGWVWFALPNPALAGQVFARLFGSGV